MHLAAPAVLGALAACSTHAATPPAGQASTVTTVSPTAAPRNLAAECPVLVFHPIAPLATLPIYGAVWPGCRELWQCPGGLCPRVCRSEIVGTPPNAVYDYEYDADGRLSRMTAGGSAMSFEYRDGRLVTVTRGKRASRLRYDGDRVVEVARETGDSTRYVYDAGGRITNETATRDGRTHTTTFTYDRNGRLRAHTDESDTWTYAYDASGRLVQITSGAWTHAFTYRPDGRVHYYEMIDDTGASGRRRISYRYDDQGRLVEETLTAEPTAPSKATRHVYDCH